MRKRCLTWHFIWDVQQKFSKEVIFKQRPKRNEQFTMYTAQEKCYSMQNK